MIHWKENLWIFHNKTKQWITYFGETVDKEFYEKEEKKNLWKEGGGFLWKSQKNMAVFRGSPGAPASSGLYPPRIACFVCGAEVPSDYPLYPLPPNGNGNNQVTTPFFPFLLTLEPPIGCRPPTPGGVAKSCRNCYSTLMRQWDEYEKGERFVPCIGNIEKHWKQIENHSMARVIMNKSEKLVTNTTSELKYTPKRARICIKCEHCEANFTSYKTVFGNFMRWVIKEGISSDADSWPLRYFDAAVVFVTNSVFLFRLPLAILWADREDFVTN